MKKNMLVLGAILSIAFFACKSTPDNAASVVNGSTIDTVKIDGHPAWLLQGNFYEVNVRQYTPEGTFNAFANHLTRLKEMGVQTLWFMPIQPISKVDRKGALGSYYAVSDYTAVNPEYGNLADWKALVAQAHEMGFKVIIDWVPNHTGGDHYWLEKHPDFFVRDSVTGKAISQFDWSDTRKLDYHNPALVDSMINSMKYWITETGIDGFRCDQAHLVGKGLLWEKCISELKKLKNIVMVAESEDAWTHEEGFDISYPWKAFHAMVDVAAGKKPASFLDSVNAIVDSTFPANAWLMYFTSNHDENSWNKADYATMPGAVHAPFAVLTQTWTRSVPLIYSGQEEPFLDSISFFYKDTITFGKYGRANFYQSLLNLRTNNPALAANASYKKVEAGNPDQVFAFIREREGKKVLVVLNLSANDAAVSLKDPSLTVKPATFIGSSQEMPVGSNFILAPWGYAVFAY